MISGNTHRPSTDSFTVQRLVERAGEGLLRVPDWQRLFQWQAKNIRDLLDSIMRGYPVGTLLLWKRPQPAPAVSLELGPHTFDAQASADALWVIDGQQRVTSLAGALIRRGPPDRAPDARDQFVWAYDLIKEAWLNPKETDPWRPEWLPADRLVDATDLMTWLLINKDKLTPEQTTRALELGRDLREFQIPAIVVSAQSDETLRRIFDRTNNAGKKLKKSEIFDALQGALSPAQPSTIRALARIPEELGFGALPKDWLLRLVIQVGGSDMTQVSHETLERKELSAALPRAAEALRRTLVFVKNEVGIPNEALLPYRLPLIVLSVFFDKHPSPRPRSLDLLSRWLWRGAETGLHRGQDIGEVRRTLASVDADEEGSVQRLLGSVARPPSGFWEWQPINLRSASTRIEVLALLSLDPRDLVSGAQLNAAALIAKEKSAALRQLAVAPAADSLGPWSALSTRLIYPAMGKGELLHSLRDAAPDIAATHAVSAEALQHLRAGNIHGFVTARNRTLTEHFVHFMASRTRWTESVRPSLQQLALPDVPRSLSAAEPRS